MNNEEKRQLAAKQFEQKAKKIHGDKYDYSLVEYINSQTKVKIICPIHGVFEQKPNGHLSGRGCSKCKPGKISKNFLLPQKNLLKKQKKFMVINMIIH